MGRFARSWSLTKTSFSVIKQDKELLWMPVLSFLAAAVAIAAIAGVGLGSGVWPQTQNEDGTFNLAGAALAFVLYILLAFVGLFFNAAVVAGATERLAGGDPTVRSALRAASKKAGKLLAWAVVVATVNVILQAIRERSGTLGRVLSGIAGMAWNLATFFMVPILLFEAKGIGDSVRTSGGLFKKTWGETVIGEGGIGLVGGLISIAVVLVGLLLTAMLAQAGTVGLAIGIAVTVAAVAFVSILFSVVGGVYKAALYRYATTGQVGGGFDQAQLAGAFTPK